MTDVGSHRMELLSATTQPTLHDKWSLADARERRDLFREQDWMPQWEEVQRSGCPAVPLGKQTSHDRRVLIIRYRYGVVITNEH